ncbi:hypothetical protein SAMN05421736_12095 [Evansella caseinilytica]|uniref:Uncharacterized protein n=1 Tax=Evansella caseinilytica TaxID=1503961 RepID=A0A1H3UEB4_9BACI|nr:hypothetical protein [Evansella caseinilytica]SDZ60718.1 hypothetical protein SAMN05421736_12095 [Evansella caseinilytica]
MGKVNITRIVVALILITSAGIALFFQGRTAHTPDVRTVAARYYEVIAAVEKLYENHQQKNGYYYNGSFREKNEVKDYLSPYMTQGAKEQVINTFFQQEKNHLVYAEEFQDFILIQRDALINSSGKNDYYTVVKNSLLNPGLKMIREEQLDIKQRGEHYIVEAKNIPVKFYREKDKQYNNHYTRLGYPAQDRLSFTFQFVESDGELLLSSYSVRAGS